MKDEIKEKLDNLRIYANREENGFICDIENYITNLQEENERYKRIFEGKKRFSKIMPDDTDFIILSKADYDRQQEDIELELIDYKQRNEKAIEYTKQFINGKTSRIDEWKNVELVLETIIQLLQGEDK